MIRSAVPAALTALVGLAACSADAGDFQSDAEKYINDHDDVADRMGGIDFSDAECERPRTADPDETFTCIASGDDGNVWRFTATIIGDDEYEITSVDTVPAREEGGADGSAPPSTSRSPATQAGMFVGQPDASGASDPSGSA